MRELNRTILLMFMAILMAACEQATIELTITPDPTATPIPTAAPTPTPITVESLTTDEPAYVRFINAAPSAGALNVYAGFSAFATNLAYTQLTESTQVDAGQYDLKILPSGSRQDDPALLEAELEVNGGESIMVLIIEKDNQLTLMSLPEKQEPLNAGESIITAINATVDGSAVTLRNGETDITVALKNGEQVTTPILTTEDNPRIAFQIGTGTVNFDEALREQQNYTLIAAGSATRPAIISFHTSAPSRVAVRALNASAEVPSIDIYLGEALLNSNAGYGRPTERKPFASGEYSVLVYAAGADRSTVEPLLNQVVSINGAEYIALLLLGRTDNLSLLVYPENLAATAPDATRLALLNTLPDAETVIVQSSSGFIGGEQRLGYGEQPTELDLEAGTYSFVMAALQGLNPATTIETAQNVQLAEGMSYLYLVTGRMDSQPIILSETVATDNTLAGDEAVDAVDRANPAQARFINAIEGQTFDLTGNGSALFTGMGYGQGSVLLPISDRNSTLELRAAGSEISLAEVENTFEAGSRYTIIAYNSADSTPQLTVIADDTLIFDGSSPHLRLINVSGYEEATVGLAFTEPAPTPQPSNTSGDSATEEASTGPLTLPYGLQILTSDVITPSASGVILMPVGIFDIIVINSQRNELVVTLSAQSLDSGIHTDVIAYQVTEGGVFRAFAIPYPPPPA